ncbi:MAG: MBOAT family protein [Treponema sp.]|nr:MBOAT family protein [Treponema sp.]
MTFLSVEFGIFIFCVSIAFYFIEKTAVKENFAGQLLFLAASLVFYCFSDFRFVFFLLYVGIISYISAFFVTGRRKRLCLFFFIVMEILPLLFFKYANFFADMFFPEKKVSFFFPLGISFFTFQALSYTIDVFMKKIERERSLVAVMLFVSFFPSITSGPIQRADFLIEELKKKKSFSYDNMTCGLKLFAFGAAQKLIVANSLALYVDGVYSDISKSYGCALFLASVLYSFQIYFDFSGYSNMAIGIARFFGFNLGRNFDHPYFSESIGEFWRRWHISLSSWLRDYVYFPLGGSRCSKMRCYLNLLVVFFVSGVWHGAHLNFVFWGLLHGVFQCAQRLFAPVRKRFPLPPLLRILVTFALVSFAWIFFRIESFEDAFLAIRKILCTPSELLSFSGISSLHDGKELFKTLFSLNSKSVGFFPGFIKTIFFLILFIAIDFATRDKDGLKIIMEKAWFIRWGLYAVMLWGICYFLFFKNSGDFSANFIYNNF